MIESLKRFYVKKHLAREYNVPSVVRFSDSFGTVIHDDKLKKASPGGTVILNFDADSSKHLRVGDTLSIEVEIDPSFDPAEYEIRWNFPGSTTPQQFGSRAVLRIEPQHVRERLDIQCYVTSNKEWHRHAGCDDFLAAIYKVLPPPGA